MWLYTFITLSLLQLKCTKTLNQSLPDNIIIIVFDNKTTLCDTKTDRGGWIIIQVS